MSLIPLKTVKTSLSGFLIIFSLWSFACSDSADNDNANKTASNQETTTGNNSAVKDNTEELANIIKLPEAPEEVVWREEVADSKGKKLIAVLKYSAEAAAKIVDSTDKNKTVPVEIDAESWFPDELTAQSQLSGNESIKATAYSANNFYNPPYSNGTLERVNETNYFVLELTTY